MLFSLAEHLPDIYSLFILAKSIARYPLVSLDQVRFCGELLFFSSFFFFFFFLIFFFFLSIFKSWDGFSPWKSPLLPITLFFFFPSFPPLLHFFFSLLFCPTPPTFPLPSILFFSHFSSVNLSMFFFFPSTSVNIHHNSSITDKCH